MTVVLVAGCAIAVIAAILLGIELGIPSETAVPLIVLALFVLRAATRRRMPRP